MWTGLRSERMSTAELQSNSISTIVCLQGTACSKSAPMRQHKAGRQLLSARSGGFHNVRVMEDPSVICSSAFRLLLAPVCEASVLQRLAWFSDRTTEASEV